MNSEPLETLCSITEDIQRDKTYKEPGADSIGAKLPRRPIDNGCFLASNWPNREEISLVPGGKVVMAMAVVLAWMEEAPDDKIISQSAPFPSQLVTANQKQFLQSS